MIRLPSGPLTAGFVLAATVGLALAAGGGRVDADQAKLCRITLPALEPAGSAIAHIHTKSARPGIRIDYTSAQNGRAASPHFAICRFAPTDRTELARVTTDRGEMSGASVYLLRRYYIDTPDGTAAEPTSG